MSKLVLSLEQMLLICPDRILEYLDPRSASIFISCSKAQDENELLWMLLAKQLRIKDKLQELVSNKTRVHCALYDLRMICELCGCHLDSVFGFFLYGNRCFDCRRNNLLHNKSSDPTFKLDTITEEGNEFGHFRETFGGMKFAPVPVSGEDILNAYGTALGGGKLKTENKTTIRY